MLNPNEPVAAWMRGQIHAAGIFAEDRLPTLDEDGLALLEECLRRTRRGSATVGEWGRRAAARYRRLTGVAPEGA